MDLESLTRIIRVLNCLLYRVGVNESSDECSDSDVDSESVYEEGTNKPCSIPIGDSSQSCSYLNVQEDECADNETEICMPSKIMGSGNTTDIIEDREKHSGPVGDTDSETKKLDENCTKDTLNEDTLKVCGKPLEMVYIEWQPLCVLCIPPLFIIDNYHGRL